MGLTAVVVVACHFESPSQPCKTTVKRLEAAIAEVQKTDRPQRHIFVVTGDVPYEPGGITLAELMRDYLLVHGVQNRIIIARGNTGSFAEPRLVTEALRSRYAKIPEPNRIIVVSSEWQLWAGLPFWEESAERAGFRLHLIPLANTGGWKTRCFYAAYAAFIRASRAAGIWDRIEPFLYNWLYAPRYAKGFRTNGCA